MAEEPAPLDLEDSRGIETSPKDSVCILNGWSANSYYFALLPYRGFDCIRLLTRDLKIPTDNGEHLNLDGVARQACSGIFIEDSRLNWMAHRSPSPTPYYNRFCIVFVFVLAY